MYYNLKALTQNPRRRFSRRPRARTVFRSNRGPNAGSRKRIRDLERTRVLFRSSQTLAAFAGVWKHNVRNVCI